jgi:hypothetical protein
MREHNEDSNGQSFIIETLHNGYILKSLNYTKKNLCFDSLEIGEKLVLTTKREHE